jgi:hypothetical protein
MTVITFILCLILGYLYYSTSGVFIAGGITIYTASYLATTASAAIFCMISKDRSINRAGLCIIGYAFVAPFVYKSPNALAWCAAIDLCMATYFIGFGAKRWEIYAGFFFAFSVIATLFSVGPFGFIPDHTERARMFIAFSQPDITAILGHAANIVIGFGAGDFGSKVRSYLTADLMASDIANGLSSVLHRDNQAASDAQKGGK